MAAYPNPSYPMPGPQAIRQAMSQLPAGTSPLYTRPDQLDPTRYNALLAAQQQGPQTRPLGGYAGGGAGSPQTGVPGEVESMGPDTQTASGGIMGNPDFTTPTAWSQFFNMRNTRAGTPPTTPPVVAGQRLRTQWEGMPQRRQTTT